MADSRTVVWQIDPAEPADPTPREQRLHWTLGCTSPHPDRHHDANAAYSRITLGWGVVFPDVLAALDALAEAEVGPEVAPDTYAPPSHTESRRRPDAARAPTLALRSASTGRAIAA
jgi:hypothetical protein